MSLLTPFVLPLAGGTRPLTRNRYKLDTTFVHIPASEALEHLQSHLEKIKNEVDSLEEEKAKCEETMDELKKELYAKFGSRSSLVCEEKTGLAGPTGRRRPCTAYCLSSSDPRLHLCRADSINLERGDD